MFLVSVPEIFRKGMLTVSYVYSLFLFTVYFLFVCLLHFDFYNNKTETTELLCFHNNPYWVLLCLYSGPGPLRVCRDLEGQVFPAGNRGFRLELVQVQVQVKNKPICVSGLAWCPRITGQVLLPVWMSCSSTNTLPVLPGPTSCHTKPRPLLTGQSTTRGGRTVLDHFFDHLSFFSVSITEAAGQVSH